MTGDGQASLPRRLGPGALTALVIGNVIGVGIFLTPAGMARTLGSPFWLLVVWLVMGLMALCGALCYGALAATYPDAGGGYVYLRETYGPAVAFLYGWKCLLVMDPGITAALAAGLAGYAGYLIPLSPLGARLLAAGVVLGLALVSLLGVRLGARVMQGLTGLKLGALALLAVLALVLRRGDLAHFIPLVTQRAGSVPLPGALAPGLVGAFFAFAGWWEISKLAGEARDPARTVPRALTLGVLVVTLVYLVTSAVFLYLVPLEQVTSDQAFAAQAGAALFGAAGARVFAGIVVLAVLGSLLAMLMALPRVYFAMARDGVFFAAVGQVHPRFGTPARAVLIQAGLACILVLSGSFDQIVAYFIFVTVGFVALTAAGLFVLRRRGVVGPYRLPGYPVTPVVFLVLAAVLLLLLAGHNPLQAGLGTAIVALGIPVYRFAFR